MNRQDALAKLNAFMVDVEKATSVAKKIEGERKKGEVIRGSKFRVTVELKFYACFKILFKLLVEWRFSLFFEQEQ